MAVRATHWALALALLVAACGKAENDSKRAAGGASAQPGGELKLGEASRRFIEVEVVAPSAGGTPRTIFGRTAFRPKALSSITAPFAGRVASVAVEPGQRVREGATLFTIESADALGVRSSLEQARLKEKLAEEVLARQTEMVRRGVGLEVERFEAEMKLREARAERTRGERNAALLGAGEGTAVQVRAPAHGVVVSVKAAPGATVQPGGEALVEIGNPGGLWIVADVPEGDAAQVAPGMGAEISVSALNLKLSGRVAGLAPRSDAETRRTPIYVEIERAPADLRAGLLVQVKLAPSGGANDIWLPVTAVLLKGGSRRVVYFENAEGNFVPGDVETGEERGGRVRMLKGVKPGDRVVMRGALLLDREAEQLL